MTVIVAPIGAFGIVLTRPAVNAHRRLFEFEKISVLFEPYKASIPCVGNPYQLLRSKKKRASGPQHSNSYRQYSSELPVLDANFR